MIMAVLSFTVKKMSLCVERGRKGKFGGGYEWLDGVTKSRIK